MPTENIDHVGHNLNVYSQSTSLLFQFILSEFIVTFNKIQEIERLYEQMEAQLIRERLRGDVSSYLGRLLDILPMLTGSQMVIANEQTFPWTYHKGSLNKLRHYCYLLSHRSSDQIDILNMNVAVSKAFHSALQIKEVIFSLQKHCEDPHRIPNYVTLYQLLDRVIDNMRRTSRLILRILIQFKEDENVLYFLLKHKTSFDKLYKTQFVARILKKMFPKGALEAAEILREKYTERGFHNLIESITSQVLSLEACTIVN